MSILREIIARFSVSVDDKDLKKLDKDLEKIRGNLDKVGTQAAVAFAAMGYGAFELVSMASHATENLNVLTQSFGDNKDEIMNWSVSMGKALGRSKYELQEYAGRFGSFLQPAFEGTDKDIAGMSEQLTQLALDLASFYDVSEEEAMMRISSGLRGETEAVRMWGIDLSDEGLTQFNTQQSGGKDTRHSRNLSMQEKNALRFAKILKDTEKKQGDLVRTQDEVAGSARRLKSQLNELGVEAGKKLVPIVKDLFAAFNEYLMPTLQDLAEETNGIQHAFELAGGAAVTLAAGFALANRAALINALVLGGLFIAFDELRGGAEGAKTALDKLAGKEEGDKSAYQSFNDFMSLHLAGGADLLSGNVADMALNAGSAFNMAMGRGGEFHTENGDAARARYGANYNAQDRNDSGGREASLAWAKQQAIDARDPEAYANAFKGTGSVLPDDPTAAYMRDTKADFERGNGSHLAQDIANGVAPADAKGEFNSATGKTEVYRGAGSIMAPVTIHMYGDNNEHKVKDVFLEHIRQANAVVGDEKSGASK